MLIRYAEVLISYAELLYEYNGSITDVQLDATVNALRKRAGFNVKLTNGFVTANGLDMKKRTISIMMFLSITLGAFAQSIWNPEHLVHVKQSLSQPVYATAYQQLLKEADQELGRAPRSVVMKEKTPPSGDKHGRAAFQPSIRNIMGIRQ